MTFARTETYYHYVYTLCIAIEVDFIDGETYHSSSTTMKWCLTRTFKFDGPPSSLAWYLEAFIEQETNDICAAKGFYREEIQVAHVSIIDKNKVPFSEDEHRIVDEQFNMNSDLLESYGL